MGTSEKVYNALGDASPGLTTAEVAAKVKPTGVRDPVIATRSALQRLRRADKVRNAKCADGKVRWLRA